MRRRRGGVYASGAMKRVFLGLIVMGLAGPAAAKPIEWAILPARGDRPPPRDPTLMRLTDAIAAALEVTLDARVRVVAKDLADQACPGDECPRDLAILVSAERAVTIAVKDDQSGVDLRVYGKKTGLEKTIALPCKWSEGLLACAMEGLSAMKAPAPSVAAAPVASPKPVAKPAVPPKQDVDALERALAPIDRSAARCKAKGWGELPVGERPAAMAVRFRVDADGTIKDVRLEPSGFSDVPAFACMARAVESTRLTAGVVDDSPRQRPLPLP